MSMELNLYWPVVLGRSAVGQTHIAFNWPANEYITYPLVPGVGNLTLENSAIWTTTDNQWHAIEWDDFVVSTSYIGPDGGGTTPPPTTDTTPPTISNGSPTGTLSAGTTNVTISLTTNENAICKYATTPNLSYASMPITFSASPSTTHTGFARPRTTSITACSNLDSRITNPLWSSTRSRRFWSYARC